MLARTLPDFMTCIGDTKDATLLICIVECNRTQAETLIYFIGVLDCEDVRHGQKNYQLVCKPNFSGLDCNFGECITNASHFDIHRANNKCLLFHLLNYIR